MIDLSSVKLVGVFVDTVRQLYNGVLDEGFIHHLETLLKNDETVKVKAMYPNAVLPLGEFHVQKMGKSCGYRYKLQNNEIGLVILLGSYYHKADKSGPHLKVECSPKFIQVHSAEMLQVRMDTIARFVLHGFEYQGVAVHLACDVQSWKPGQDFLTRFSTYARFIRNYIGLQTAEIGQGFSDVVCKYGSQDSETLTIGKPTGLQTSIYNKTKQAVVVDKVDYYDNEWTVHSLGEYDKQGPDVYRVEFRFHHSVIKEFQIGEKTGFINYEQIADNLNDLWRYALLRNRLDIADSHIDPVWQLFYEDVRFQSAPPQGLIKRQKKNDFAAVEKNYQIMLGNFMSIFARKSTDVNLFFEALRGAGLYHDIVECYRVMRKMDETEFREKCAKSLKERRLLRNAA